MRSLCHSQMTGAVLGSGRRPVRKAQQEDFWWTSPGLFICVSLIHNFSLLPKELCRFWSLLFYPILMRGNYTNNIRITSLFWDSSLLPLNHLDYFYTPGPARAAPRVCSVLCFPSGVPPFFQQGSQGGGRARGLQHQTAFRVHAGRGQLGGCGQKAGAF